MVRAARRKKKKKDEVDEDELKVHNFNSSKTNQIKSKLTIFAGFNSRTCLLFLKH